MLQPHLETRHLGLKTNLEQASVPIDTVCFFESGLGSMVAKIRAEVEAEVGLIGSDGMSGSALVMGEDRSPHDCFVQLKAEVVAIDAEPFRKALESSPTLRLFLLRYVHYLHIQTSYTALINARSNLEQRMSRWLLMCDDRVIGGRLATTHEFLSIMLGTRRPGVTVALQQLEGRGLIRGNRGEVVIRDRAGLAALADGSYGQPEAEYIRLIGTPRSL